jgi:hypothetical protein
MRPLLDEILGYNKIKVKGADVHKTTPISIRGTMTYKFLFSSLPDASTAFKIPIHTTLDELINIHIYLDDIIKYIKRMIITLEFQVLSLGPFKIDFFLDTNSYILRDLQEQLFSYSSNGSRLKYCEGPT